MKHISNLVESPGLVWDYVGVINGIPIAVRKGTRRSKTQKVLEVHRIEERDLPLIIGGLNEQDKIKSGLDNSKIDV